MVAISNEKRFKCIPQNLCMSDAAPVCQPWTYASSHPMEQVLTQTYFLSESDRLRPGDTMRIVEMVDNNIHARTNKVLGFADVVVMSVSRDNVEIFVEKKVDCGATQVPPQVEEENPAKATRRWNPGKKVHEAVRGDEVLFSDDDKEKVDSWLQSQGS